MGPDSGIERPFDFEAAVFRWEGEAGWFFVALPDDVADEIADLPVPRRGFGSVRVEVTVGATTWRTSLFPDSRRRTYLLPVKRAVREREGLVEGDVLRGTVRPLSAEG